MEHQNTIEQIGALVASCIPLNTELAMRIMASQNIPIAHRIAILFKYGAHLYRKPTPSGGGIFTQIQFHVGIQTIPIIVAYRIVAHPIRKIEIQRLVTIAESGAIRTKLVDKLWHKWTMPNDTASWFLRWSIMSDFWCFLVSQNEEYKIFLMF